MAAAWAHPSATAAVTSVELAWNFRAEVALPLLVAAAVLAVGWWRLSRRAPRSVPARRPALALVAFGALVLALLSPLDALAEALFVAHMIQHMLLIMVAAPALLLADPFPIAVWAVPAATRIRLRRWITRRSPLGRLWNTVTAMGWAWIVSATILWGWHWPRLYDAALSSRWLHDLEHLSFFAGALLFWWPVIRPAPRWQAGAPHPLRVVYVVLGAFQTAALGLWLTLAPTVLYRGYAAARPGGLDPLDDQTWGGVVMWALGGLIDTIAVLALVYRSLGAGPAQRASLARSEAFTPGHSESTTLK